MVDGRIFWGVGGVKNMCGWDTINIKFVFYFYFLISEKFSITVLHFSESRWQIFLYILFCSFNTTIQSNMHVDLTVELRRQYFLKVGIHCHEDVDKVSYIKSSNNLVLNDKSSNSHSSCTAFTGKILIVIIPKNYILYLSDVTDPSD